MKIDKKTYKVSDANYYSTPIAKTQIVIASSLRIKNYHINRLLHKDYGASKKWNTFSISRDGKVYQHYSDNFHSDFLGIKDVDKRSISIVLENMGFLFKTQDDKYINWLNEYCDDEFVVEKKWLGYDYWEKFYDEQIESVALLCKFLCEKHNIPKTCIDFNFYHKEISKFRGIVFRSNYFEDSSDINPLFDIEKFNEMLGNDFK